MKIVNVVVGTEVQIKDHSLTSYGVMKGDTGVIEIVDGSELPCVHWTGSPTAHSDKKWWVNRTSIRIVKDK